MPPYQATARGGAVFALAAANVAFAFQQTAVIPALPTVSRALQAPTAWTAWLLSGYLLAASVSTPLLGKLADRYGRRRVLLGSMLLFLAGSVGAALAPTIAALIGFRSLQGVGGAIFPVTLSIARETARGGRVGPAIGFLTGLFGMGTALGFGLGGFLTQVVTWRSIFVVGAVPVVAAAILVRRLVPPLPPTAGGRLDLPGGISLGGGFATLLLALTLGVSAGWNSRIVAALFVGTVVLLAAWAWRELRVPDPFIDLRLLRSRTILLTNIAMVALGYALFGTVFLLPHLVQAGGGGTQYGFSASATVAGLYLVPASVGQLLAGPLAGNLAHRYPAKWAYLAGMLASAAATGALAAWHHMPWQVLVATFVLGTGVGLAIGASSALVTRDVPAADAGVSAALNTTLRRVGGGVGGQVGAALLAVFTVAGTGAASEFAFVAAFSVAAGLCLLGAVLIGLVPRQPDRPMRRAKA